MDASTAPVFFCIALAAMATAALIHQHVPSYEAFVFRRTFVRLALRRAFTSLRHAFDPDARRLDRYARAMGDLETAVEFRDGLEKRMAEELGQEGLRAARELATFAVVEGHLERKRAEAARYLGSMSDADIARVARLYQRGMLEGKVDQGAVEQFFRDERDLVRASPHLANGHFDRMEHRFNLLCASALARPLEVV
ncbi:MAG TPA: hypothetical protein VL426_07130 [Candidatus Binatia bacterium]|jgi:hypothetical protein|nr:hypothetical protein [Candidatus Binatia bacterium]